MAILISDMVWSSSKNLVTAFEGIKLKKKIWNFSLQGQSESGSDGKWSGSATLAKRKVAKDTGLSKHVSKSQYLTFKWK